MARAPRVSQHNATKASHVAPLPVLAPSVSAFNEMSPDECHKQQDHQEDFKRRHAPPDVAKLYLGGRIERDAVRAIV